MFLASSPKPIDTALRESVDKIEQQNPAISVLAARQLRYKVYQAPVEVTVSEPRNFNVLEEFILRAGIEVSPAPKPDELAHILGLDPVFVKNTASTLRNLKTLASTAGEQIALTSEGRQFYEQGSVPQPPQTKEIYAVADPLNGNLILLPSPVQETNIELPDLEDFVTIEDRLPDNFALTLEEVQELSQRSGLGLHVPEEGKIITSWKSAGETQEIWQFVSIFVIYDVLEDKISLQVRRGKRILEDASNWLDALLGEEKVSLEALCELSDETIARDRELIRERRNEEVERRIEQIEQIALESLKEGQANGDKTGGAVLLRDSQIRKVFLETLNQARQNILIYSPWVSQEVVDSEFIQRLQNLANRGVWIAIGHGIARRKEDEDRPIPPLVEAKLREVKTPEGLPAVQVFWLGNSHAKEVVVDRKIHLCGSQNWLSYRGDRLPRGETVCKITIPEQVLEAYKFLGRRFESYAHKAWNKAVQKRNFSLAAESFCVWGALGMEKTALKQLQQNNRLDLLPVWLKVVRQGLRSQKLSPDWDCLETAVSLLSEISENSANLDSLREGWQNVVGAIALQNREIALTLLNDAAWLQFVRLGIAQPPIDSREKFISQCMAQQKQSKNLSKPPGKNSSKNKSKKKK